MLLIVVGWVLFEMFVLKLFLQRCMFRNTNCNPWQAGKMLVLLVPHVRCDGK